MGILDKLKPQPRWKHADANVRLEALKDLNDPAELSALALGDSDSRVRRAAVARVDDVDTLGRVAASDAEADIRDRAADRLVFLASRTNDAEANALAAVRALTDPRRLSTVAKSDVSAAVRGDALARIVDERALSSIARHAKAEDTAASALARITDQGELLDIALHADHREVATQAFDRLVPTADLALLRSIEARAQHKPVSRRARIMIQDIENTEAARRAAVEERRRKETLLVEAMEQLADVPDVKVARAEHARLHDAWVALGPDVAASDRFDRAFQSANAAIVRREREAEELADRARLRAEAIATRVALCERVETLDGDDVVEQLVPIEEEWRSLLPLVGNGPEADRLAERFAQAVAACRKRHEMGAALVDARSRMDALVAEAEALPSHDEPLVAAQRWRDLGREARGLSAVLSEASRPATDLQTRLAAVDAVFAAREAAREAERQAALDKARHDVLSQIQRLSERAKRASEADAITLREGERLLRDISAGLDASGVVASTAEIEQAVAKLRELQGQVAPRVRELREMDDWRRFANAQRQEQLIAMAEAIVGSLKADEEAGRASDLAATAKALRELHTKWQEVAEAPRQTAQRLWDRFRAATDFIRSRCETYFAKLREERVASLEKKLALVTEAEELAASNDWAKAAARFQELQTAWQALGPATREAGRDLAQRFRTACNAFFARRREDLADRKKVWTDNLAKKEALCQRAEELAESTDWEQASAAMKSLQAEWKTVGPVRRNKSEVVWNRFRAAADRFFERFHHRHEIALASKLAEREAMVVELEALVARAAELAPTTLGEQVQTLRTTWNRAVPIPAAGMKPLADRWQVALSAVTAASPDAFKGTDLDASNVIQRMEKLVARVEALVPESTGPQAGGGSATEQLAARLRSALASNAMGGRVQDDTKSRAAVDAVKDAQAAWQRLPPTSLPEARGLEVRFREACRRVTEQARRSGGGGQSSGGHGGGQSSGSHQRGGNQAGPRHQAQTVGV